MIERAAGPPIALLAGQRQELEDLLRRCIQCGLCLPACATWLVSGDETMSPRGRLVLLGAMLADPDTAGDDDDWRRVFDTCIGCRACSAVCPSGVPFEPLERAVAAAREPVASPTPAGGRFALTALTVRLDTPRRLRAAGRAAAIGRAALRLLGGARWRAAAAGQRCQAGPARLVGAVPRGPGSSRALERRLDALVGGAAERPSVLPAGGAGHGNRGAVLWFEGCANEGLLPDSSRRLRELLAWAGADVRRATGTGCCGALAAHGGQPERAAASRERNLAAWGDGQGADVIVTEAAGCGLAIADYGAGRPLPQVDAIVWLSRGELLPFGAVPLKVVLHDPCHARHGLGISEQPRSLLRSIPGLTLLETPEPDVCCGSGGLWALAHAELASDAGLRKARLLAATGADLIVTANPGCLGQINDALDCLPGPVPLILPLGDLLWYAARRASPIRGLDARSVL